MITSEHYAWLLWSLLLLIVWAVIYLLLKTKESKREMLIVSAIGKKHKKIMNHEKKKFYCCPECGLHYESERMAKKCEAWCGEHKSCNLEIISHAVENKNDNKQK